MFRREAAVKHMLLASESPKYLGMEEGILNVKLLNFVSRCRIKPSQAKSSER